MEPIVSALGEQQAELTHLLVDLDDAAWAQPSPCEGWSVADVVLHLAQTNDLAIASASGRFAAQLDELTAGLGFADSIDDGADLMVARDRGRAGSEILARWQTGAASLCALLDACDPSTRVTWVAGGLSARTLATTRLAETWIHTGDVATALGVDLVPTDRLWHIARLAWRTLPYAFERASRTMSGPVDFELIAPSGTPWTFTADSPALTTIRGDGVDLCRVASRRVDPADTALQGDGPDAVAVLELVRTWA